jgi:hypothetical protein
MILVDTLLWVNQLQRGNNGLGEGRIALIGSRQLLSM